MLRCENLTVHPPGDPAAPPLLDGVNATFRPGVMNALIGPSGSGKTMLVKAMLGLVATDAGSETWLDDERVRKTENFLGRVGFAPQFSIAQPKLTVNECIHYALELTVDDARIRAARHERILKVTGLENHRDKRVESLSGGQLRRLGLGLELTVDPPMLICDEVTSGLDPLSEDSILEMLRLLARTRGKTLLCIIHNLAKLDYFEWITVINHGQIVFQGTLAQLHAYFDIPNALRLYDALESQPHEYWAGRWTQARSSAPQPSLELAGRPPPDSDSLRPFKEKAEDADAFVAELPTADSQFWTLLRRRVRLFFRDYGYLGLVLGITFGFPLLVVIFALDGLPQVSSPPEISVISQDALKLRTDYAYQSAHATTLVTSLVMFQVILLTLMGANNGAREIAGERMLFEKERMLGVSAAAYAGSKLVFTGLLAVLQATWMYLFVDTICQFPGASFVQLASLAAACMAMTWVCLAFSAWLGSAEKAYTLSIYLVGFQLPLSGVVLALPSYLEWVFRPFINAYWGWAGYFSAMRTDKLFDAYTYTNKNAVVAPALLALAVLCVHAVVGAYGVWTGCKRRRWSA